MKLEYDVYGRFNTGVDVDERAAYPDRQWVSIDELEELDETSAKVTEYDAKVEALYGE